MSNNKNFIAKNGVSTGDGYSMPDIRPSLLLDFANSKTLDPRITFTRGSTGTYWDGKTTTKAEENLSTNSQTISNLPQGNTTATDNDATAPDGTTTATKIVVGSTTNVFHDAYTNTLTTVTGDTYTHSVYVKAGTGVSAVYLYSTIGGTGLVAKFNISTGAYIGNASGNGYSAFDSYSITSVGNSWYRIQATKTETSGASRAFTLGISNTTADTVTSYNGNGTDFCHVWGRQIEIRSSATAYTATTTTPIVKYQPTLQTAASGEARFDHDPVTGESKGLLIEESRTNLVPYSDFTNSSGYNNIFKVGSSTAPDGTQTATILRASADSQYCYTFVASLTLTQNTTYTYSVFVKAANSFAPNYIWLLGNTSNDTFNFIDPSTGTLGTSASGVTTRVEDVGNGWYRCAITFTNTQATGAQQVGVGFAQTNGSPQTSADETQIEVWGEQIEAGSFPTSYIPTSGSTVTRSTDSAVVEGTAFTDAWSDDEVTVYASGTANTNRASNTNLLTITSTASNVNNRAGWSFRTGTGSDEMLIDNFYAYGSAVSDYADDAYPYAKVAYRFKNSDFAWTVNYPDNPLFTDSVTTGYGPAKNKLYIGATYNGTAKSTTIEKIAFYPAGLSNATLQAMTEE